jgi:dTDP-3-amino-3,4,6-trideoxy-alpha-D-glucose transaminase
MTEIPLNQLIPPEDTDAALIRVARSGVYLEGHETAAFERELKEHLGGETHTLSCHSGTDALVLSLRALGASAGDEVILPSLTAPATAAAVRLTGACPIYADLDPERWVLDEKHALSLLSSRTRAILAVHLYGNMVDLDALKAAGVPLLEDTAQAQGARLNGRTSGTIGRFGAFSFYPTKNLGALGDGGAVACTSEADARAVRHLKSYGYNEKGRLVLEQGINSRLGEFQASVLRLRLREFEDRLRKMKLLMGSYRERLAGLPLAFQKATRSCEPAWHLCVIALEDAEKRDQLQAWLRSEGVQTKVHYPTPCHREQPAPQNLAAFLTRWPPEFCLSPSSRL